MTDIAVVPVEDRDHKRQAALMKAIGLDRVPNEQRELALAIAKRYELDLLLKHLVLVDGRPYITRDGLLHVAHRSGQLDGIEVSDPELVKLEGVGDFWRAHCSVYRKDMSRPFTYMGRYPAKGGNQRFAPEMAVKVAEVMALRRAFDVSAPVIEERWDIDVQAPPEPLPTITETIAAKRAALTGSEGAPPPSEPSNVGRFDGPSNDASETRTAEPSPTEAGAPLDTPSGMAGNARRGRSAGRGSTPAPHEPRTASDADLEPRLRDDPSVALPPHPGSLSPVRVDADALASSPGASAPLDDEAQAQAILSDIRASHSPLDHEAAKSQSILCGNPSPFDEGETCDLPTGHRNAHRGPSATWQ